MTSYLPKFISWPHAENAYSFSHDGDAHNQLDMVAEDQIIKQGGGSYTYNGVMEDSQEPAGTYPNIENLTNKLSRGRGQYPDGCQSNHQGGCFAGFVRRRRGGS